MKLARSSLSFACRTATREFRPGPDATSRPLPRPRLRRHNREQLGCIADRQLGAFTAANGRGSSLTRSGCRCALVHQRQPAEQFRPLFSVATVAMSRIVKRSSVSVPVLSSMTRSISAMFNGVAGADDRAPSPPPRRPNHDRRGQPKRHRTGHQQHPHGVKQALLPTAQESGTSNKQSSQGCRDDRGEEDAAEKRSACP